MIALRNWLPRFGPDDRPASIPQQKKPAAARMQHAGPREIISRNVPQQRPKRQTRRRKPQWQLEAEWEEQWRELLIRELTFLRDSAAASAEAHLDCELIEEGQQYAARAAVLTAAIAHL